jgi:hypothetical protein
MKTGSRLLLGTLATAAALGGSAVGAAGAQAADSSASPNASPSAGPGADDGPSLDMNTVLCPVAASGFVGTVLNRLNKESIDRSCGGLRKNPAGGPIGLL